MSEWKECKLGDVAELVKWVVPIIASENVIGR